MSTVLEQPPVSCARQLPVDLPDTAPPALRLLAEPQGFDFFQAVRLLEQMQPQRRQVGGSASPEEEVVRFSAAMGAAFPASSIADLNAEKPGTPPEMTVAFLGLTGPSGALPSHYTDLLWRIHRDVRTSDKHTVRAWFDLFNHRLTSLFYRAWEKYRPFVAYQRGEYQQASPDTFTQGVLSFAGLSAAPALEQNRLPPAYRLPRALMRYAGLLAQRPRNVANLQAILSDFFALDVEILQFQGEWIPLACDQQMQLGLSGTLGSDAIVGPRVWNRQGKIRVRIGPLAIDRFERLLPCNDCDDDQGPHLGEVATVIRFYLGPEMDFDLQLILRADQVPNCQLGGGPAMRLGWNTWLPGGAAADRDDACFASA